MRRRPTPALVVLAALLAACSATGEPGHTAAVDVVRVGADGLTQTVVPATDGFDRITVTVATFGEPDGVDGVLELEIAGAGEVRRAAAAGDDLGDNVPVTLAFEPFTDAAGRTFEATFRYAGERPVALYRNPYDPYPDGELRPAAGDLVFTLGHADRVGGSVAAVGRAAREAAGVATGDPFFLALWLGGLVALAAAAAVLRRRDVRRDRAAASR